MCRSKAAGGRRCVPHLQIQLVRLTKKVEDQSGKLFFVREHPDEPIRADFNRAQQHFRNNQDAGGDALDGVMTRLTDDQATTFNDELSELPDYPGSFTHNLLRARALKGEIARRQTEDELAEARKQKQLEEARTIYLMPTDEGLQEWKYTGALSVTFTEEERAELQKLADEENSSLSEIIRSTTYNPPQVNTSLYGEDPELNRNPTGQSSKPGRTPTNGVTAEGNENRSSTTKFRVSVEEAQDLVIRARVFRNTISDQIRYEVLGIDPRTAEAHRSATTYSKKSKLGEGEDGTPQYAHTKQSGAVTYRPDYFKELEKDVKDGSEVPALYQRLIDEERKRWVKKKTDHETKLVA